MSLSIQKPFDETKFRDDLEINLTDLSGAFATQASLFSYYAAKHVQMMRQESQAKILCEIKQASTYKKIRDAFVAAKAPKITEAQIDAEILRDRDYVSALNAYNEARAMTMLAKSAEEAFRQRRDMLIQLGASHREEMKGDLRMMEKNNMRTDLTERLRERMSG